MFFLLKENITAELLGIPHMLLWRHVDAMWSMPSSSKSFAEMVVAFRPPTLAPYIDNLGLRLRNGNMM
jgi:hypothetical protein